MNAICGRANTIYVHWRVNVFDVRISPCGRLCKGLGMLGNPGILKQMLNIGMQAPNVCRSGWGNQKAVFKRVTTRNRLCIFDAV